MGMSDPQYPETSTFDFRLQRLKEHGKGLVVLSNQLDPSLKQAADNIMKAIDDAELSLVRVRK